MLNIQHLLSDYLLKMRYQSETVLLNLKFEVFSIWVCGDVRRVRMVKIYGNGFVPPQFQIHTTHKRNKYYKDQDPIYF